MSWPLHVKLYSARMQIEEAFRGVKSYRLGTGFELNITRGQQRLVVVKSFWPLQLPFLMLIGMLANSWEYLRVSTL